MPDKREAPQDAELISAAETIASWARARRATWTSVPLPPPAFPREDAFIAVQPKVPLAPPTLAVPQPAPPQTSTAPVPTRRRPVPPWIGRALVAAVLVLAAAFGARALLVKAPDLVTRLRSAPPPTTAAPRVAPTTGSLDIKSTPPGARVLVDGKPRGLTPLNLDGIVPGRHEVTLSRAEGTVRRVITVAAGETVTVDEAIFSGWAIVLAPFDLTIAENGRVLPADDRNQILLAAGPHQLRLTNSALGYDTTKRIDVKPGETTRVELAVAPSALTVTADEPAEVWIDGVRAGETPLTAAQIAVGTHDVVVRRAVGGERRFTVTVGVSPASIHAVF